MNNHWPAFWISLISIIVGVLVSFLAGLYFDSGVFLESADGSMPSWNDAFGFAGVIITILAFVGAFFILFTALDAFSFSREIAKNRSLLKENTRLVEEQERVSNRLETQLRTVEETTSTVERQLLVFDAMVAEFGSFNVDFTSSVNSQIDFLSARAGLEDEIRTVRGSRAEQYIGMARLDALAALASISPDTAKVERGKRAAIELLEPARGGSAADQAILLLLHDAGVSSLAEPDRTSFLSNVPTKVRSALASKKR